MKITDACIYPYPYGDSSVRRMALEARSLGFERLVAVETVPGMHYGIEIVRGILIERTEVKDIIARIRKERDDTTVISVQAADNRFNRAVAGLKGIHILRGLQYSDRHAFDHVTAKIAADNQVAVDIDLSVLVQGRGITRQRALHRYHDILVLQHRFGFPLTVSSHAHSVLEMRGVREISGLCSLLGMDTHQAEMAFAGVDTVTATPDGSVRVV